jgi:hypothetical protein
LKSDFRLSRNLLKGQVGDEINVLMAACAWNMVIVGFIVINQFVVLFLRVDYLVNP